MKPDEDAATSFGKDRAASYDDQWVKLAAMKEALHLFTRVVFAGLPEEAQILCVGAGTGAELLDLARHRPRWHFTAVEPAGAMLEVCRAKAEEAGIAPRCRFHEGYLDSLPPSDPFDAATCFLVSHFLTDKAERQGLFAEIAARLRPEGLLVSADISADMDSPAFARLLPLWLGMMRYAGFPEDQVETMRSALGQGVAVLPANEVAALIEAGGFADPVLIFQSLLVHAWSARRAE